MTHSFNEIASLVKRAAIGVGVETGVAEDLGRIAVQLEAHGAAGLALTLKALSQLDKGSSAPPRLAREAGALHLVAEPPGAMVSAIYGAPALADLAALDAGPGETVTVERPDVAGLVLGGPLALAGRAMRRSPFSVAVQPRGGDAPVAPGRLGFAMLAANGEGLAGPVERLEITRGVAGSSADDDIPESAGGGVGLTCASADIDALQTFAARMLVPDSDVSRLRGAGAGLVDND